MQKHTEHGYQQHTAQIGSPLNAFRLTSKAFLCLPGLYFPSPSSYTSAQEQRQNTGSDEDLMQNCTEIWL